MNRQKSKLPVLPSFQMKQPKSQSENWVKKGGCGCGKKKAK